MTQALGSDERACDPARILRLLDTQNFKYESPRPVTLLQCTDARVNVCELEDVLPREVVRHNAFTIEAAIPEGERNDTLYRVARAARSAAIIFAEMRRLLHRVVTRLARSGQSLRRSNRSLFI